MQWLYRLVYSSSINKVLRSLNKLLVRTIGLKFKLPPSGILKFQLDSGDEFLMSTNQSNFMTHLLFWNGYKEFEYTKTFLELIPKIKFFMDIGSNIGYYSILAEKVNPNIEVIAFEPASGPNAYLKENVAINKLRNVKVEDLALSEKDGEITFYEVQNTKYTYLEHNLSGENNAGSKTEHRQYVKNIVPTTTLASYVENTNISGVDLNKLDTEGTEHFILKNAGKVLSEMRPIVICETLYNKIEPELEEIFKKHGYLFFNYIHGKLVQVDSIRRQEDNGVRDCFFVHPDKIHLIENLI